MYYPKKPNTAKDLPQNGENAHTDKLSKAEGEEGVGAKEGKITTPLRHVVDSSAEALPEGRQGRRDVTKAAISAARTFLHFPEK
ncbi:hypothetical protein CHS0354_026137 [Potamilus streckersoni]|uniref:Uncharacterized protein n=1 Tax=Potamilus streckersoni TaxID=2493646 RepID=A0AAE0S1B1_9BIVA|nr:hypothetical protein CHS0354_026137 [Potamilus streckersoni]